MIVLLVCCKSDHFWLWRLSKAHFMPICIPYLKHRSITQHKLVLLLYVISSVNRVCQCWVWGEFASALFINEFKSLINIKTWYCSGMEATHILVTHAIVFNNSMHKLSVFNTSIHIQKSMMLHFNLISHCSFFHHLFFISFLDVCGDACINFQNPNNERDKCN